MRPECCAGVFSIRSRPPIPPPPRPESLRPESANPLFFPPVRRKWFVENRARAQGLLSFYAAFCVAIGKTLRTGAVRKSEAVQCVARSAAAGRPGNFLQNEERSFQIRETGQPSGLQAYFPESEIERPCKNAGWLSGRVPVRLGGAGQNPVFPVIPAGAPGLVPGSHRTVANPRHCLTSGAESMIVHCNI